MSPPVNDNCIDAIELTGEVGWMPFSTAGATDDGPVPSCQPNTRRNIWYRWTADRDGRIDVYLCESPFDTVVAVYEGDDCANLTEIACDDDSCGGGNQSVVTLDVTAGTSYLVSIGGWNDHSGIGEFSIVYTGAVLVGACCTGDTCVGTLTQESCAMQGGSWVMGGDCESYICGACPEDKIEIQIRLDPEPEYTSWELIDDATGVVIAFGGGYVGADTHLYQYCVPHGGCYHFTLHDDSGDGLMFGSWLVTLNGVIMGRGTYFEGDSVTTRLGNGCDWPTGACCVGGDACVGGITNLDCEAQGGAFYVDEDCDSFTCPYWTFDCPGTSIYSQNPAPWGMLLASETSGVMADSFANVTGLIHGLRWWGAWLDETSVGSAQFPCTDTDPVFQIRFFDDAGGQPGALVNEYTVRPTWATTGVILEATGGALHLLEFSVDQLIPPCNLTNGWISIEGIGDDSSCMFRWLSSNSGNGWSYQISPWQSAQPFDLAFCLDGAYDPILGACCDDATGSCTNDAELAYCLGRFAAGVDCEDMSPPCGVPTGACCHGDGTCDILPEASCTDNWLGAWSACEECPCILMRPAGAVDEMESCGADANGGCHMTTPTYNPITLGVPVWGTLWADGGVRDTDWYEIVVNEPTVFTWSVEVGFDALPMICGLAYTTPLGVPDCSTAFSIYPYAIAGPCEPTSVTTVCVPAGTYWFWVSALGFEGMPCGPNNHYVATLTAEPCIPTGACCHNDNHECVVNYEPECDALGGVWTMLETCETHACDCPTGEVAIDIEVGTDMFPRQTRWELVDSTTDDIVAAEGPYENDLWLYTKRVCVSPDRCYTFTIHDAMSNGLCCYDGQGYYAVLYDGNLVRLGGEFNIEQSTDVGPNCMPRAWACCVAGECVGDMPEADCTAQGGTWTEEASCADGYDCSGEVDFRLTAPVVNVTGCNCHSTIRCGLLDDRDEHIYLVTVPQDGVWQFSTAGRLWEGGAGDFALFVGTTLCGAEIGRAGSSGRDAASFSARIPAGDYYVKVVGHKYPCGRYVLNIAQIEECEPECPAGATQEGEPQCYDDYIDVTDGGCDAQVPMFIPITDGETVCGTAGTYFSNGVPVVDSDWYQIELPAPAALKWDVCSTFPATISLAAEGWGGCEGSTANAESIVWANVPATVGISAPAGKMWLRIAPRVLDFMDPAEFYVAPDSTYVATLTIEYAATPGACCHIGGCTTLDREVDCYVMCGGQWHAGEICRSSGGDFECPVLSACCMPNGTCLMIESEMECSRSLGGTWHQGMTCSDAGGDFVCPAPSACCANGRCMMMSEFECVQFYGGTWNAGEICAEAGGDFVCPAVPPSACCTGDGTCQMAQDEMECIVYLQGTWYAGQTCVDAGGDFECPALGACCMSGYCIMLSEFECVTYAQGTWNEGQICVDAGGDFECPIPSQSACCLSDGYCVMMPGEFECVTYLQGTWHEGQTCVNDGGDFTCPTGDAGWCDLDGNDAVDYDDYVIFLAAFGGPVDGDPAQDAACDFDGSGAVGLADYNAWLECYRDLIGDPLAGPPSAPGTPQPGLNGQGEVQEKNLPAVESAGETTELPAAAASGQASGAIKKLPR